MPHTLYVPLYYSTPIIMLAHAPTHFLQKWLESIVVLSWRSLHIHNSHHTHTHQSPSKWLQSNICYFPFKKFLFSTTSIKYRAYYYLTHTLKIHPWLQNPCSRSPILWRPHPYHTNPAFPTTKYHVFFVTHYLMYTYLLYNITAFHPLYTAYLLLRYMHILYTPSKIITINNIHKTEHVFSVPCLCGANPNLQTPPRQARVI